MKAIDLCCGAGGLTNGLRRAGWDVVAGIDVDEAVGPTYQRNNPGTQFVHADLRNVSGEDVHALANGISSRELLLAGCAPCQAFSKQRGRRGIHVRADATLLTEFGRLVVALRPRAVLMENVPGIAEVPGFSSFRRFIRILHECGYGYQHRVLNAQDFGVPQHRRRRVLVALLDLPPLLPLPRTAEAGAGHVTVRRAIAQFPAIEAGEAHPCIPNHQAARLSPREPRADQSNSGRRRKPAGLGAEVGAGLPSGRVRRLQRRLRQDVVGPRGAHADQPVQQPVQRAVRASRTGSRHQPSGKRPHSRPSPTTTSSQARQEPSHDGSGTRSRLRSPRRSVPPS